MSDVSRMQQRSLGDVIDSRGRGRGAGEAVGGGTGLNHAWRGVGIVTLAVRHSDGAAKDQL